MHDYELDLGRDSDDESLESFFEVGHKRVPTVSATMRIPVHGGQSHGHAGHPVPVHRPAPPRPASRISGGGRWTRAGSNIIVHGVYAGGGADREFGGAAWETEHESETGFGEYFRKCMSTMGLPVPTSIFTSLGTIKDTVEKLVKVGNTYPGVTIGELVGAGVLEDAFSVAEGLMASYYAGACLGCLATATGQKLSGGLTLGDAWHALTT